LTSWTNIGGEDIAPIKLVQSGADEIETDELASHWLSSQQIAAARKPPAVGSADCCTTPSNTNREILSPSDPKLQSHKATRLLGLGRRARNMKTNILPQIDLHDTVRRSDTNQKMRSPSSIPRAQDLCDKETRSKIDHWMSQAAARPSQKPSLHHTAQKGQNQAPHATTSMDQWISAPLSFALVEAVETSEQFS
jgi:hypothetical protein